MLDERIASEQIDELAKAMLLIESEEEACEFCPPDWFGEDVTFDKKYHNCNMIFKK